MIGYVEHVRGVRFTLCKADRLTYFYRHSPWCDPTVPDLFAYHEHYFPCRFRQMASMWPLIPCLYESWSVSLFPSGKETSTLLSPFSLIPTCSSTTSSPSYIIPSTAFVCSFLWCLAHCHFKWAWVYSAQSSGWLGEEFVGGFMTTPPWIYCRHICHLFSRLTTGLGADISCLFIFVLLYLVASSFLVEPFAWDRAP